MMNSVPPGRCGWEEVLVLPRTRSEMSRLTRAEGRAERESQDALRSLYRRSDCEADQGSRRDDRFSMRACAYAGFVRRERRARCRFTSPCALDGQTGTG